MCVVYKEENISFIDIIDNAIKLYSKEIFVNRLKIEITISNKVRSIKFNELLLQQILVSLLHDVIDCSKKGGFIKIEAMKSHD